MQSRYLKAEYAVAVTLLGAAPALAQPGVEPLFSSSEDVLGNSITYPDATPAELTGSLVTMMPGDNTGWHVHDVPTFGYVISGRLTVEYAAGEMHVFEAGDGVIEAQNVAHNGHNRGNEPVVIVVFQAGARGVAASRPEDPPRPADFVDIQYVIPDIEIQSRYSGTDNFVGRPVAGYEAGVVYLTREAAEALGRVQAELRTDGLGLKVFDGYRPQRAVDDFMRWAADLDDRATKARYYPSIDKSKLIPDGYIAERSGHSRGSTVDLTLIDLGSREEIDMGSPYDFFDPVSWPSATSIPEDARANRMRLREIMLRHGFEPLDEEWWHFTLRDEPYPERYFDFPVR
jgi:D-alanyl-D-alanine dipeptidase